MVSFSLPFGRARQHNATSERASDGDPPFGDTLSEGSLKYVFEKSGNGAPPAYQEASGAPVEVTSPLGYSVGPITIIFLNLGKMIGTGVFSTPGTVLKGTGSIGLSLIFWFIGFLISLSSISVYLEYAAYFPNRSGSEVVYLEQAYPRPRYFFPLAFAVQSVVLSFSSGNAIVLSRYLWAIGGTTPTDWQIKGVAVAGYSLAVLLLLFSTKYSYWLSNGIGVIKLLTLVFIGITGLVVLGGHTRVADPKLNFRHSFDGKATPYGVTNSVVKIIFSYAGYENAFNMVNEIRNPVKQVRNNGFIALLLVATLYILANIAYFAAVPKAEFRVAKEIAASLFFTKVFGSSRAVRGLNFLIALSAFGNLIAVLLGQSRLIRECGRQGVLPWPRLWASTKPFGTPLGPYFIKWILTVLMILAPPAGDAFNFTAWNIRLISEQSAFPALESVVAVTIGCLQNLTVSDLKSYPDAAFFFAMGVGLYIVRYRRKQLGLPRPSFRAWDISVIFNIIVNLYVLIMPWYPPDGGRFGGNVSFWYASYVVTGIGILALCLIYYVLWIYVIPKLRKYEIRQEVITLDDGAQSHRLVKVPVGKLEHWDATHDALGREIGSDASNNGSEIHQHVVTPPKLD